MLKYGSEGAKQFYEMFILDPAHAKAHREGDVYKRQVLEYLMTLLNSNFEEWRRANPDLPMNDFQFTTKKMSGSGALFDIEKLRDVSKNVISRMTAEQVYDFVAEWSAVKMCIRDSFR